MRSVFILIHIILGFVSFLMSADPIDRESLVARNNPRVTEIDTLSSLTVGNGEFAFTVDVTGLQSFPEYYRNGIPLGTQSQWGWHSFPNTGNYSHDETLGEYDFGHGHTELYSTQLKEPERGKEACEWFRVNPHRLHLGAIGFVGIAPHMVSEVNQMLDMWSGTLYSNCRIGAEMVSVKTCCHPDRDMMSAEIISGMRLPVSFRFPYPTGAHADDACDWTADSLHVTEIVSLRSHGALLRHSLDDTYYYINVSWSG